jgi:hypothetical protein
VVQQAARLAGVRTLLLSGYPEGERQRDEPLLGAVVEVTLQPTAFVELDDQLVSAARDRDDDLLIPARLLGCAGFAATSHARKSRVSAGKTTHVSAFTISTLITSVRSTSGQPAIVGPSSQMISVIIP